MRHPVSLPKEQSLRAFVLGAPTPLSAGLAHEWLRAGNRIVGIYCARRGSNPGRLRNDKRLGHYCPQLSISAIASHCGIDLKLIGAETWDSLAAELEGQEPDVILSLMFMARIPSKIIAATEGRLLNIHPALLPDYRGLSSLSSMQYDGTAAEYAGLTLHVVTEEFDEGPIVSQIAVPPPKTGCLADHLHALITAGEVLVQAVPAYLAGRLKPVPQDMQVSLRLSHAPTDLVIRPSHHAADIMRILGTIGPLHKLAIQGLSPSMKVDGFLHRLGPAERRPPRVHWRSIDLDLADCRARLRRVWPWRDKIRKIMMTRRLVQLCRERNR